MCKCITSLKKRGVFIGYQLLFGLKTVYFLLIKDSKDICMTKSINLANLISYTYMSKTFDIFETWNFFSESTQLTG